MLTDEEYQASILAVGRALHHWRQRKGMSGEVLGRRIGASQSKISRIESGQLMPTVEEVSSICRILEVPPAVTTELRAEVSVLRTSKNEISSALLPTWIEQQTYALQTESAISVSRHFIPRGLPAIVQTAAYAARAARSTRMPTSKGARPFDEGQQDQIVSGRMTRQSRLYDRKYTFWFLIAESSLRSRLQLTEMSEQLSFLQAVSKRSNIHLGILPITSEATYEPAANFVIYDNLQVVFETMLGDVFSNKQADVISSIDIFELWWAEALVDGDAREFIEHLGTKTGIDLRVS